MQSDSPSPSSGSLSIGCAHNEARITVAGTPFPQGLEYSTSSWVH